MSDQTAKRKEEHIRICLEEDVQSRSGGNGFEQFRFRHAAMPEIDFKDIHIQTTFLGKTLATPLLISSMTGGTSEAGRINLRLAEAAEARGWAIGLGSMRAAVENEQLASTFHVRHVAPNVPVIANIGAVQLNYGYGVEQCLRAVDLAEADALVFHLNSMQEVFQPEGDTNFRNLYRQIEHVCRTIGVPVGVKEVGWGIDSHTAVRLANCGVAFIDVAGAGGTSWSQVEKYRFGDPLRSAAANAFVDWGISTAACVQEVREQLPHMSIIASGGLNNGVEAAKAIALGANIAGYGRRLLADAMDVTRGSAAIAEQLARIEFELRAAMFGIGVRTLDELSATTRIVANDR